LPARRCHCDRHHPLLDEAFRAAVPRRSAVLADVDAAVEASDVDSIWVVWVDRHALGADAGQRRLELDHVAVRERELHNVVTRRGDRPDSVRHRASLPAAAGARESSARS